MQILTKLDLLISDFNDNVVSVCIQGSLLTGSSFCGKDLGGCPHPQQRVSGADR